MDELLKRLKEIRGGINYDVPDYCWSKFPDWKDLKLNSKLKIEWIEDIGDDFGYIFLLPGHLDYHVLDALTLEGIVHIPEPCIEKEMPEPEWIFLVDLLTNPLIKKITTIE